MVFQNHSLLPWLTCFDNVALAVDQVFRHTMSKAERREWIEHNLDRVQMGHAPHKRPGRSRRYEAARGHCPCAGDEAESVADG